MVPLASCAGEHAFVSMSLVLRQHAASSVRKFYSDFNTVFLLCLSCCLLLV